MYLFKVYLLITIIEYHFQLIRYMISKFQLESVKNIKTKYLSGGQRKRLSIANLTNSFLNADSVVRPIECNSTNKSKEGLPKINPGPITVHHKTTYNGEIKDFSILPFPLDKKNKKNFL